ncbi:hypothetical protein Trydic_g628 [Trypoxylus dichotomus]
MLTAAFRKFYDTPETDVGTENAVQNTIRDYSINNHPYQDNNPKLISPVTLRTLIKQTTSLKAPGPDNIRNVILKNVSKKTVEEAILIHKLGKPSFNPPSHRSISILPTLSKVTEHIIYERMIDHIKEKNIIPHVQFGFRARHSMAHQAARVITDAIAAYNRRNRTTFLVMDMEKAFNRFTLFDPSWMAG